MANEIAQRVDRQGQLREFLESPGTMAKLKATLPRYMSAERLIKISLVATTRNPDLLESSPASILAALIDCTRWGLEPDGIDAALVPRKSKHGGTHVQLEPMYRGLIRLARRSGQVRNVRARCVYEGERFRYRETLREQLLDYRPDYSIERTPQTLARVFAVAELAEGEPQVEIMTKADVDRIRAKSRAQGGPWSTDYEEMARKTVIKRLMKFCPRTPELDSALATLDTHEAEAEVIASAPLESEPAPERQASPAGRSKRRGPSKVADALPPPSASDELSEDPQGEPEGERVPAPAEERGAAPVPPAGAPAPAVPASPPAEEARPAPAVALSSADVDKSLGIWTRLGLQAGQVANLLAKAAKGQGGPVGSTIFPRVFHTLVQACGNDANRATRIVERVLGRPLTPDAEPTVGEVLRLGLSLEAGVPAEGA